MENSITQAQSDPLRAVQAFWEIDIPQGPVRWVKTSIDQVRHEHLHFDTAGRISHWLHFDDEGKPYRRDTFLYTDLPAAMAAIRQTIHQVDGKPAEERRYLIQKEQLLVSCYNEAGRQIERWQYAWDSAGRPAECLRRDGQGRLMETWKAYYNAQGRLITSECIDAGYPPVSHHYEYGPDFRRIRWDGGPAGQWERLEQYEEKDAYGNWLRMHVLEQRDGAAALPESYLRCIRYCTIY